MCREDRQSCHHPAAIMITDSWTALEIFLDNFCHGSVSEQLLKIYKTYSQQMPVLESYLISKHTHTSSTTLTLCKVPRVQRQAVIKLSLR